ncbi:RNA polymerase sigma-70 factor [Psychroserpens sp.]|uniref:RNA polymerase sigma factor n=1 Tax=Psychroserpens sp. TaxID=2020870 RepID=UPI001B0A6514|nr:RNA polymerase sigma-70 factor [Psychroserpens sp.]MBO6607115.1 RNA polymerase sigma-70 factor [Psychroserpens sp.]MBO6631360.1 RNA polymerase sigma-70 factor [Psychroserpens sp.]MBO6654261.1 RNA polymerase sigma-70 factor [Psychroserpens sp.]MBO6682453.1 RNA polymerase sigma-70 factor [Psychroserpens sp.]MBO6750887.1 RNA polymerase sigma-70 factor [Psychroserpens sp.]
MTEDQQNICNSNTFETIYQKYAKDLRRFLFFKTQDLAQAEDILQDTFIKLWNNCSKVNYDKVKSYLYTVASNAFLNTVKHQAVVRKHQSSLSHSKTNESPEFIMIEQEFLEKLERVIASLPDRQREVFLMNRIDKKKYKEIAVELNISVKAVEKRMHAALVVMRKEIGNI